MPGYTAFLLSDAIRDSLLEVFAPSFDTVKADHITHHYGAEGFDDLFIPQEICVTHYIKDPDGLEALKVTVDGKANKPDGRPYHITWSLDKTQTLSPTIKELSSEQDDVCYKPQHANDLIKLCDDEENLPEGFTLKVLDFKIPASEIVPAFIAEDHTIHPLCGTKTQTPKRHTPKP